jgi:hypothetical protein
VRRTDDRGHGRTDAGRRIAIRTAHVPVSGLRAPANLHDGHNHIPPLPTGQRIAKPKKAIAILFMLPSRHHLRRVQGRGCRPGRGGRQGVGIEPRSAQSHSGRGGSLHHIAPVGATLWGPSFEADSDPATASWSRSRTKRYWLKIIALRHRRHPRKGRCHSAEPTLLPDGIAQLPHRTADAGRPNRHGDRAPDLCATPLTPWARLTGQCGSRRSSGGRGASLSQCNP